MSVLPQKRVGIKAEYTQYISKIATFLKEFVELLGRFSLFFSMNPNELGLNL